MIAKPGARAPSATLPLAYLVAAAGAFLLAALALPWVADALAGHYYQPRVLALTHTVTLGWIGLTIMGASYQLVPVVLERPIWSERLARWQLGLLILGIAGLVAHFWTARWPGLVASAGLVTVGVGLYLGNMALTLRGLTRWTFTARLVVVAFVGLTLTAAAGLLLGLDKLAPFLPGALFSNLHAHFHLALLGWVLPMVMGVAARAYPMFLLAREPHGWPGSVQLWGVVVGAPLVVVGLLAGWPGLVVAGALATGAAVGGHLVWVATTVRDRRRPALDWGLRLVLTGAALAAPAAAMGVGFALGLLSGPRLGLAYAALALGGWASLTIAGMMLKIVPFLVWYHAYSPRAGRAPVPTLGQLGWPRAEALACGLLTGGALALAAALAAGEVGAIRVAGALLAAGALAFVAALARVLAQLLPRRALDERPALESPRPS